jgi:hypothetical protein
VDYRSASCQHCSSLSPKGYPLDLQPLWLHASSHSCPDWSFSAPLPPWAADEFECQVRTAACRRAARGVGALVATGAAVHLSSQQSACMGTMHGLSSELSTI